MEKFKNIIENKGDNSRRFENIHEELLDYEFQYIEKLEKGELKEIKNNKIEELNNYEKEQKEIEDSLNTIFEKNLFKYTELSHDLNREYYKRVENNNKKFKEWLKNIFTQIGNEHLNNKKWKDNVNIMVVENLNKIGPILPEKNNIEQQNDRRRVGLINFDLSQTKELEDFGIDKNDECLNIHFRNLYSQKKENNEINNVFSGESFSKLAIEIIENHPEIKAIIGRSWLIGSPVGKRVGFQVIREYDIAYHSGAFWGQFINENGELKKEKMQEFLNTGIPEFLPASGFIKIEDFLKKYLPKDKRGIVKLKEISGESKKFREDINLISKELDEKWVNSSYEEIISIASKNQELIDYFNTQDGKDYLSLIKKIKDSNMDRIGVDMDKIDFKNKSEVKKKFENFIRINSNKFTEKEVLID